LKVGYIQALTLPAIAWIVCYTLIAVTIKLFPALVASEGVAMGTGFLDVLGWSLGAWAGYKITQFGGNFISVMFVSVVMAIVAALVQIVMIGAVVGDFAGQVPVAVFNLMNAVAGTLTAGGFALTK
jgi:uncharacterized membrane protein